jgi:hypothetical protein
MTSMLGEMRSELQALCRLVPCSGLRLDILEDRSLVVPEERSLVVPEE